jgi:cobalt-zinc-cadmium efflux system protein
MSHVHVHQDAHDDHHDHGHGHGHAPRNFGRAFALGIALNAGFVVVEAFYGWQAGSLALLADAGHNLSDVAGLVIAWAALAAGRLKPTERHTYGWRRGSILAGFTNAAVLLVAMGSLAWEAALRLQNPAPVAGMTMILVAAIGVAINGLTAVLFIGGHKHDLNIRGAFLHMAADALVSLGVVITGALYLWQGWAWVDPVASIAIALVIIAGTWSLFRQSLSLLFDGVPMHIELGEVRAALLALPNVAALHDLHVWALASMETALTAHVVLPAGAGSHDELLHEAALVLRERFGIAHVTLQVETEAYEELCAPDACSGK